jgi:hypothetical protein
MVKLLLEKDAEPDPARVGYMQLDSMALTRHLLFMVSRSWFNLQLHLKRKLAGKDDAA